MKITYKNLANAIRFLSIDAVQKANSGHPGMPMGMADVATVLFKDFLKFSPKKGAKIIRKVLESAIANAEHNDGVDIDELFVEKIFVERGTKLKRFAACAKGRGVRIEKTTCHIFISVATIETKG